MENPKKELDDNIMSNITGGATLLHEIAGCPHGKRFLHLATYDCPQTCQYYEVWTNEEGVTYYAGCKLIDSVAVPFE